MLDTNTESMVIKFALWRIQFRITIETNTSRNRDGIAKFRGFVRMENHTITIRYERQQNYRAVKKTNDWHMLYNAVET